MERSVKLSQEYQLDDLRNEEHQVEVTENIYDAEGLVNTLGTIFNVMRHFVQLLQLDSYKSNVVGTCYLVHKIFHSDDCWSDNNRLAYDLIEVHNADSDVYDGNNGHSFKSWEHRLHKDVKVTIVLRPTFYISLHIEPIGRFQI